MIKKNIPNVITLFNVFFGCCAVVATMDYKPHLAIWFIFAAAICDFADGLVARSLQVHSPLGKELDSLADMISFGLVPGVIMFKMLYIGTQHNYILSSMGFIVTIFSALRLAIFNVDTRQSEVFIGLATPASTVLVAGVWMWYRRLNLKVINQRPSKNWWTVSTPMSAIKFCWALQDQARPLR